MNESKQVMDGKEMDAVPASVATWPVLSGIETRILGCLMEKATTTPEQYPLTINALLNACNQKSNRYPIMSLSEDDVVQSIDTLRHTHRLAAQAYTAGSRVEKFKHTISSVVSLNHKQAAILCELLLRGPETVGELRTRASRLHPFDSLDDVQRSLHELASNPGGPLVVKLAREPGRREPRWMHLLAGPPNIASFNGVEMEDSPGTTSHHHPDALTEELRALRVELDALKEEFASFKKQFE